LPHSHLQTGYTTKGCHSEAVRSQISIEGNVTA
jgi:hypothetical protein